MRKPSYVVPYARARGISPQAMLKQLRRAGVNPLVPFDWERADKLLNGCRRIGRDHLRKRKVTHA